MLPSRGFYGGPVPVGESSGLTFNLLGGVGSFILPLFASNVALTTGAFLLGVWLFGRDALSALTIGAIAGVVIGYLSMVPLINGLSPVAGFPLPVALAGEFPRDAQPNMILLWVDSLLTAGLLAGARGLILRRRNRS